MACAVLPLLYVRACTTVEVTAGKAFTCARSSGAELRCWGNNAYGQLGYEDSASRGSSASTMGVALPAIDFGSQVVSGVSAGRRHQCGIAGGQVVCWGYNFFGELGQGSSASNRGTSSGDMTGGIPSVPIPASAACTVVQVSAHFAHTCALCGDKLTVFCWGYNHRGQLGLGDTNDRGRMANWELSWGPTDLGMSIETLLPGSYANHNCAVTSTSGLKCWGDGEGGQLGYGSSGAMASKGDAANEMGTSLGLLKPTGRSIERGCVGAEHTCVVYTGGDVECWGTATYGQLGTGSGVLKDAPTGIAVDLSGSLGGAAGLITCGGEFTCAASADGSKVVCWGRNSNGQLGYGDTVDRGSSGGLGSLGPILLAVGSKVVSLAAGREHTCIVIEGTGEVECWGLGNEGQLGTGSSNNRGASGQAVDLSCVSPTSTPSAS
eukprot:Hpha_TRINITY_DN14585_c0_g1::TRINITY_DN14585_c0_g1_i1::g.47039::m.47039